MIRLDVNLIDPKNLVSLSGMNFVDFSKNISKLNLVEKFGAENLTSLTNTIKDFDLSGFSQISNAIGNLDLDIEKMGSFLNDFGFESVDDFMSLLGDDSPLQLLDDFLAGGNLDKFISATSGLTLDSLTSFLSSTSLTKIIDKSINLPGIAATIKSFVNVAKSQVDTVFSEFESKLGNLESRFNSIKSNSLLQINNKLAATKLLSDKVVKMKTLLQESKKEELKEKIDEKSARTVGSLNEIKNIDVQYVRGLITGIPESVKEFFQEKWDDLKNTADELEKAQNDIKAKSNDKLKESVESGRPAGVLEEIKAKCQEYGQNYNSHVDRKGGTKNFNKKNNIPVPSNHPEPESWSNLRFTQGNVLNMKWVEDWGYHKDIGYYGCDLQVLAMGNEVGKMLGATISIISAYRPPEYNRRIGGATRSQHMKGFALDCSMSGINRTDFVNAAKAVGFRGFGYYSSFIHVDIGPERRWTQTGSYA